MGHGTSEHLSSPLTRSSLQSCNTAVLGMDLAGVVESVGPAVISFKAGDEVYGMTGGVGGLQGTLAEFAAVDPTFSRSSRATLGCVRQRRFRSYSLPLGKVW